MSLNLSKLEKVRELSGGIVQARCPACAEGNHDRAGEHLRVYPDGRFGCCVHPKDGDHRKRIWALAGARQPGNFRLRLKTPPALPAAQSVKDALTGFAARTLRTPVSESVSSEAEASQPSSASQDPDSGQSDLQSKYFRTLRTPFLNPHAYARKETPYIYVPVYMCKETGNGVLPVLTGFEGKALPPPIAAPVLPDGHHCRLPYLTPGGTLVIPFDSPERYHWWKLDGERMSVTATLAEVKSRGSEIKLEEDYAITV